MTATDIDIELRRYFGNFDYALSNVYLFGWESDFICCSNSGYWYEIEIKLTRSDFKADFKKTQKYLCFKKSSEELITLPGHSTRTYDREKQEFIETSNHIFVVNNDIPHRFFYACPEGLIKKNEVPDFAGLLYVKENHEINPNIFRGVTQVKTSKFLHKRKYNMDSTLLNKYYHRYLERGHEIASLKSQLIMMQDRYRYTGPDENDPIEQSLF